MGGAFDVMTDMDGLSVGAAGDAVTTDDGAIATTSIIVILEEC